MPPKPGRWGLTLDTLRLMESVLRKFHEPLSLGRIKEALPREVPHSTLREEVIEHYKRLGCVTEGSKGVMWTLNADAGFWEVAWAWERR